MSSSGSYSNDYTDSYSYSDTSEEEYRPVVKRKEYTKDYALHELSFSPTERALPEVDMPEARLLTEEEFFVAGLPNVDIIKDHLRKEGRIHEDHLTFLLDNVYELLCAEPNVLVVPSSVTVCGDIHGQYYDLLKLLEIGGDPSSTTYLFLGDYVDRGDFGMEVCILLFSYKMLYPDTFFMLRGNHECRHLTEYFTFKEECIRKYGIEIYDSIMDVFDALPLAAVMNQQFFCVHGGISPDIHRVEDINTIDRFTEPPSSGPMCDLLWADPMEDFSPHTSEDWQFNELRKTSWSYSYNATWMANSDIKGAHEAQDAGYKMYLKNDKTGFPSLITLFSAPAYLSHFPNKAAILRYEKNVMNIRQFNESPHPYNLPNFMNVFAWSLPFVAEKLGELSLVFLNLVNDEAEDEKEKQQAEDLERRRASLRNKVQSVSRMLTMFKKLREDREAVMKLGAISPDGQTIPASVLDMPASPSEDNTSAIPSVSAEDISKMLNKTASFEEVSVIERVNEARPDPSKLEDLVESSGRMDSPKRIQRKISRDNIRESSIKFKSSLENLRMRPKPVTCDLPQIGEVTKIDTQEGSISPPASRHSCRGLDALRKTHSGERLKKRDSPSTSRKRLVSSEPSGTV